jgi:hypothetical protein
MRSCVLASVLLAVCASAHARGVFSPKHIALHTRAFETVQRKLQSNAETTVKRVLDVRGGAAGTRSHASAHI